MYMYSLPHWVKCKWKVDYAVDTLLTCSCAKTDHDLESQVDK